MKSKTFEIVGEVPLIFHNGQLANPFNKWAQAMKEITGKRKKTEADAEAIYWIEWQGSLYYDPTVGPYIPSDNLESFINDGARRYKRGQDVLRGVIVSEKMNPLQCKWPKNKSLEDIYKLGTFVDIRGVVNPSTGGRSMRCRPIFHDWSVTFTANYNPEVINDKDLIIFVDDACKLVGLCDGKPKYGRGRLANVS